MTKRAKKHPQCGWRIPCFFPLSHIRLGELFQVEQISEPAGFVSQTRAIENGTTKASLSPTLSSNGYNFGYWEINGVRQAGSDGRSLTTVTSVISQTTTYKASYLAIPQIRIMTGSRTGDEYRLFGDLSRGSTDDPDGMDIPIKRASLGRTHWWWTKYSGGRVRPVVGRVCLCRYFHGAGHDQERPDGVCH